jgi:hypothetical protein
VEPHLLDEGRGRRARGRRLQRGESRRESCVDEGTLSENRSGVLDTGALADLIERNLEIT